MPKNYVLGIDLGTTNCVVAYAPLAGESPEIQLLPIPQLVAPRTVEDRPLLPSFVYLPRDHEVGEGVFDLPWRKPGDVAVGELARRNAAAAPERTVAAAKSWLCHSRVDRRQPILPWNAPDDVAKISPVLATQRLLEHLVGAWQAAFPDFPVKDQHVVLTVPASFDASARELTREAALAAGLPEHLVLLEEPQAAVYAWLDERGDRWRRQLKVGDILLVCDVGGGTTDLTLIGVTEESGTLALRRVAVGDHLLVGGDNMDLVLAHHAARLFQEKGVTLDPWQSVALWHSCRAAKEALLADDGPKHQAIAVAGRGSRLVGKSTAVDVDRKIAAELLLDGFLPRAAAADRPIRRRGSGFQEIGLPFETDTAITRHLAAFLQAHAPEPGRPVRPTHVLFNGGVFKAATFRGRLLEVLAAWAETPPQLLDGPLDLECAVARGAAFYGWSKEHGGLRIRGGTARAYYVAIETAGLAVPGAPRPLRALCVVPVGMEEGTETDVPSGDIGLVVGEPAQFRFFNSTVRKQDRPGTWLNSWAPEELAETDSLEATLPAAEGVEEDYVPVRFHSLITELGMFELWCVHPQSGRRWKFEFSVRDDAT